MHMSFYWDYNVNEFLFSSINVHSVGGLIATCFVVALLAFIFECLRYLQARQRQKELMLRSQQLRTICPTDSSTLLTTGPDSNPLNIRLIDRALLFAIELLLWFLLHNLGYILMLSVMVYNGWVLVSVVFGGGLGYFIFGQLFMKINLQNCQIIRDTFCMSKCGEPDSIASTRDGESTPALEIASTSGTNLTCYGERIVTSATVHSNCH